MTSGGTVPDLLRRCAEVIGDQPAFLVDGREPLTFAEWDRRSDAAARGLAAIGVGPGDGVALHVAGGGWADYAVAHAAVHKAGGTALHLNAFLTSAEVRDRIRLCRVRTFVGPGDAPVGDLPSVPVGELEDRGGPGNAPHRATPETVADVLFTSGTTGPPKGVAVTHASLTSGHAPLAPRDPAEPVPGFVNLFPLGTTSSQGMLMAAIGGGRTIVPLSGFADAHVWEVLARAAALGVDTVMLPPARVLDLLRGGGPGRPDTTGIQALAVGSAPLAPALAERLAGLFPGAAVYDTYASIESAPAWASGITEPGAPDTPLWPGPKVEVRVTGAGGELLPAGELGDIWLRSPAPGRRYVGDPDATAATFAEGWVRMGDLGSVDAEGALHLFDRRADAVIRDGRPVSTLHIENVLYAHPWVAEAAAVGVPAPDGAVPAAAVVLAAGCPDPDRVAAELTALFAERRDPTAGPVSVRVLDAIPRGIIGKPLKRELRALLAEPAGQVPVPAHPDPGGPP